jgi:hypothetical protein
MNFKMKRNKIIVSIIFGIIGYLFGYSIIPPINSFVLNLINGVISFVLVYLIWSLIQKKK